MTNTYPTSEELDRVTDLAAAMTMRRFGDMDASSAARLTGYLVLVEAANQMLAQEVHHARSMGQTWQQIGHVLGTTRQAAQQRFGS